MIVCFRLIQLGISLNLQLSTPVSDNLVECYAKFICEIIGTELCVKMLKDFFMRSCFWCLMYEKLQTWIQDL